MPDDVIVHEVLHAAMHGERLLGVCEFSVDAEERLCYRAERLFGAVQEFRDIHRGSRE